MADAPVLVLSEMDKEVRLQLQDEHTKKALLATTFKGISEDLMRQAILEGMMRGFSFKSFLVKDIYAIKYGDGYSLITSIDHARKIGARWGVVGVEAPEYEVKEIDGKETIVSCTVTVKKMFTWGYVGDFTATVDFKEYSKGRDLWLSKPRTMISKVAEMHALRKACPDLAGIYGEEEFAKEIKNTPEEIEQKVEAGLGEIQPLPIPAEVVGEVVDSTIKPE